MVGSIKVNVDASVYTSLDFFGVGVIIRNHYGVAIAAASKRLLDRFAPHLAECMAIKVRSELVKECNLKKWSIESDAVNIINTITNSAPLAPEAHIIEDIKEEMLMTFCSSVNHCSRSANKFAHSLAQFAINSKGIFVWKEIMPIFLGPLIYNDYLFCNC
ncbi:hypothetical protein AXF42_Ash005983 [Apostasia shenzhenica]|uniref:RNase H type-1 domain-containing protein n=1 Tax=Apostasia shenzhenica TaxID=1088818 RepID=A0A2I0AZW2_9ASPA|nr:hypothetical protein AXF42_Ash005983 [Apostasia shenzhenica]